MHLIDDDAFAQDVCDARGGDRAALEAVVRAIEPLISRLALRFFGCPHYAKDATQEALLRIVVKLDSFETQSAFSTWAYRVAINKFLSMARSPAERQALSIEEFDEDLANSSGTAMHSQPDSDLELMLAELRIGCTLAMLLCLERDTRLAYILGSNHRARPPSRRGDLGLLPGGLSQAPRARSRNNHGFDEEALWSL
jgi:RNA polymerase sigma factor (sigma-70 family)